MGRPKLTRQERLRRIVNTYPEVALLPSGQYRTCERCYFKVGLQVCPFNTTREDPSLEGCAVTVQKWNEAILSRFGRMFETDALRGVERISQPRWEEHGEEVSAWEKWVFRVKRQEWDERVAQEPQDRLPRE
ncbi:MAG: hypothetical protein DDT31_01112 [Syntrophomonadaceae bacterium]|nr:hypothetical protein [Bacillota bacterium]